MAEVLTRKALKIEFQEPGPAVAAVPVLNAALAAFDKKVLVVGGIHRGLPTAQCLEFDALTRMFTVAKPLPHPRAESTACVDSQGNCLLFGGWSGTEVLAAPLLLEPATAADVGLAVWRDLSAEMREAGTSTLLPAARRMHSSAVMTVGDRSSAFVFGGFDGASLRNDLWEYAFDRNEWRRIEGTGMVPAPRDNATLIADAARERLLLFGGYTTSKVADLFTFEQATGVWTQVSTQQCPTPRFGCFGIVCGNHAIIGLGQDAKGASRLLCQAALDGEWKWTVPVMENDADMEPNIHYAWCVAEGGKRVVIFGGTDETKFHTAMLELDFDKTDPVVPPKGKK